MNDSVGIVTTQYAHFKTDLHLESGRRLGPLTLAYETYGQLNSARDNALLVTHAWTGDAHAAGRHHEDERKP
ncbi:MAG: homoserine O-acetyltransferase, partial [Desulfuromonadales bacterium]|nr:homoserine O-acetyltransferase [Desulfuromonadales bacterium]